MKQKKNKKPNIPLRRKMAVLYQRVALLLRMLVVVCIYLIFFTKYFSFIRTSLNNELYEITADLGLKLENVIIDGQQNTTSEDILTTLNADKGTPIFSINLAEIKDSLEKDRWINSVIVERRLPNTIYISLNERRPIAIWQINQQLYLIDNEGYQISDKNIDKFSQLLHVVGTDANLHAEKLIEDLSTKPAIAAKVLSAVRFGERRWNLNLQENIVVKMPENDFEKALEYLAQLHEANKLFAQDYKILDLRVSNKYYLEKNIEPKESEKKSK